MELINPDLITVHVVFCGKYIPHAKLKPGDAQTHKIQGFKKFEQFPSIDPETMTMQELVD